jgi:Zn-dependent protease
MGLDLAHYVLLVPAVLMAITFHEYAHARVALAFGDRTAHDAGRVTLNPLAHLDPIGTIGIFIGGFGWGRPVPVNSHSLRHPRADFFVAAAGPGANFVLAFVTGGLLHGLGLLDLASLGSLGIGFVRFCNLLVLLNLGLGLFNLLPLHPLDGSHMVENLLPLEQAYRFKSFSQSFGMPILFSIILIGVMTPFSPLRLLLYPPISFLLGLLVPHRLLLLG